MNPGRRTHHLACTTAILVLALAGCTLPPEPGPARPTAPAPSPAPAAPAPLPVPAKPAPAAPVQPVSPPTTGPTLPPPLTRTWGFEQDNEGWTTWGTTTQSSAELTRVATRSTETHHQGAGCLMVRDELTTANLYAVTNPALPAAPGQAWLLSAWIRTATADQPRPELAVAAESTDPSRPMLGWVARVTVASSTTWTRVQLPIPALPAGTTRLRLAIFPINNAEASPAATATIYLDAVRLVAQSLHHLDLAPVFNRGLSDQTADDGLGGWTDQGDNDLRGLKAGALEIGGLGFTISDPAKAVVGLSAARPGFPSSASLTVGRTCDRLHLIHTAAWAAGGSTVASLAWRYADGSEATSPVVSGDEVGDWWSGSAAKAASTALRGINPQKNAVYLFATSFENPQPDRAVTAVELRSAPGPAIWLVLAAATSSGLDPLIGSAIAARDRSAWPAFSPTPCLPAKPLVDLSNLLDAPAGKHGFVSSEGGRLRFADGTRARFWGTNIHACYGLTPSHEQAERIAATLARYGMNLVRFHLPDSGLVDITRADRQTLVGPELLDRFDYLVKCLADRGIYMLVDAVSGLSGRQLGLADGVEGGYSGHRPGAYYVPRLRELADDWSRKLLTRRNVHTGRALVDEPAVALVLIQNEQSMFFEMGTHGAMPIPEAYRQILERDFATWLRERYQERSRLAAAWAGELRDQDILEDAVALAPLSELNLGPISGHAGPKGPQRTRDSVAFMQARQMRFDRSFTAHLRELGVKVPVIGTNLVFSPAELCAQQVNDLTCHNAYYEHVTRTPDRRLQFANRPQPLLDLLAGDRDLETAVAAARLAGKAHSSTETDTMFPQEWRATYGLSIAATSAHQDWDAVMHYNYMGGYGFTWDKADAAKGVLQPTVEFNDPALTGLFPAASLMFLRGDVAAASSHVQVVYSDAERTATRSPGRGAFPYGYLTHVSRVDAAFETPHGSPAAVVGAVPAGSHGVDWPAGEARAATRELDGKLKEWGVIARDRGLQGNSMVSDTGELVRDWGRGLISVNTARSQGASGFLGGKPLRLQDVELGLPGGGFATVMVSSLDGLPIASSRRLLLTTVGRAENDDQVMAYGEIATAPDGTRYGERLTVSRAKEPGQIRIEPVRARIVLPGRAATLTPLAADLQAGGPATPATTAGDGRVVLTLGDPASVWYLVEVEH